MRTPILSKKQQRTSLSGSNNTKKVTIKNVLETPFCNYFPIINEAECDILLNEIKKIPKLTREKPAIAWEELKDLTKEERKNLRNNHEVNKDFDDSVVKFFRNNLSFGTNKTSIFLENRSISAVLISEDVKPRFMVHHVINMCVKNRTPVLIVAGLRNALKNATGISSITFGVRNNLENDTMEINENTKNIDVITGLNNVINDIYKNYPAPKEHALCYDDLDDKSDDFSNNMEIETEPETSCVTIDFHLIRKNPVVREFIPAATTRTIKTIFDPTFIKIDKTENVSNKKSGKYQGLKVYRFKNNKNRKVK